MEIDVRSHHFELSEKSRAYLDKKLERLHFARDIIITLSFSFTKEKEFTCECTIHFRWGERAHIVEHDFDIDPGIDKLIDRMETKISKDKERMQEKK